MTLLRAHAPLIATAGILGGFLWDALVWVSMSALAGWLIGFTLQRDRW